MASIMLLELETEPYENVFGGEAVYQSGSESSNKEEDSPHGSWIVEEILSRLTRDGAYWELTTNAVKNSSKTSRFLVPHPHTSCVVLGGFDKIPLCVRPSLFN